jgi:hypothetical protein
MSTERRGALLIDPGELGPGAFSGQLELVLPYTDPELTRRLLQRAVGLTAGLLATISLVAVHVVPFPADFHCPTSEHAFLVNQLIDLAAECPLAVNSQVVLARSREDGFRHALRPESTILIGTYARLWRTEEERLARTLAADGHKVALLHIEKR